MKGLVLVCAILAFVGTTSGEEVRIDDLSIPFLYQSRVSAAERFLDDSLLAGVISERFKRSRDEFERHEMMKTLKPEVDRRLADGASASDEFLELRVALGDFDFERKGFPTGLGPRTFVQYELGFAVMFENGGAAGLFAMEVEKARELARDLTRNRDVVLSLHGEIVGHEHRKLRYAHGRVLYIRVNRMVLTTDNGTMVESAVGAGSESEMLKTCEDIRNQCAVTHESCKERCDGLEDVMEKVFCHGRCRDTWSECHFQC